MFVFERNRLFLSTTSIQIPADLTVPNNPTWSIRAEKAQFVTMHSTQHAIAVVVVVCGSAGESIFITRSLIQNQKRFLCPSPTKTWSIWASRAASRKRIAHNTCTKMFQIGWRQQQQYVRPLNKQTCIYSMKIDFFVSIRTVDDTTPKHIVRHECSKALAQLAAHHTNIFSTDSNDLCMSF